MLLYFQGVVEGVVLYCIAVGQDTNSGGRKFLSLIILI